MCGARATTSWLIEPTTTTRAISGYEHQSSGHCTEGARRPTLCRVNLTYDLSVAAVVLAIPELIHGRPVKEFDVPGLHPTTLRDLGDVAMAVRGVPRGAINRVCDIPSDHCGEVQIHVVNVVEAGVLFEVVSVLHGTKCSRRPAPSLAAKLPVAPDVVCPS